MAPLLLAGCSFLAAATGRTVTEHEGYQLTCVHVSLDACARTANDFVHGIMALDPPPIVSMEVDAHGVRTVCHDETTSIECIDYPQ